MRQQNTGEKQIADSLFEALHELLPYLTIEKIERANEKALWHFDMKIKLGRSSKELRCVIKTKGEPRYLYEAIGRLMHSHQAKKGSYPVVIAPHISKRGQKVCREAGVGYIDLTGNVFLKFNSVFVEKVSQGRMVSDIRRGSSLRFPFSGKSSRIVRILLENPRKIWTFPMLSREARVNIRTGFLVVSHLTEMGFVDKKRGAISLSKPGELLDYWSENYSYQNNRILTYFSFARTFEEFKTKLVKISTIKHLDYALTLHSGASLVAPFVRFKNVHLYIRGEPEEWGKVLNLKPVESGGTVHLLLPYDEGVFYNKEEVAKAFVVCSTQLYVDLLNYPARGREQAEFLRKEKINF